MQIWSKFQKKRYFITFSFLFAAIASITFSAYILNHKSLIWNGDGMKQHYIALAYFGKWGREILKNVFIRHTFQIPLWDFPIGYGSDILTTFHYYAIGDPLNLLSILIPQAYTEYLYSALIVIRMYLAGICFSCYCMEMKQAPTASLAGSFQYVFCTYMLRSACQHPFFMNAAILLPLLLIGAERIFHRKKSVLFSVMVCLSVLSNFYFFYTLVFAVCFYVLVRFFTLEGSHSLRRLCLILLRFTGYALVGVCMAGVLLLPVILQFLGTNRMNTEHSFTPLYPSSYYENFLFKFILPGNVGKWISLGFSAPGLVAVIVLFSKKKQKFALKISFLILTGMLLIPFFGYALNGFSYVSNRWCYLYAALVSYILVTVWQDMLTLDHTSKLFVAAAGIAYFIYFMNQKPKSGELPAGLIFLFVLFTVIFASQLHINLSRKKILFYGMLFAVLLHVCLNWQNYLNPKGHNFVSKAIDLGTAEKKVMATAPFAVKEFTSKDQGFFRYETDNFNIKNTASLAGVHGIQYYWSLENACISDYLQDMAPREYKSFNYSDLDRRTFPGALAGIKYFVQANSGFVPFGYEYQDSLTLGTKKYHIYENRHALPLGYTYDTYIPYESWAAMSPIRRQEALLQGIVLEDNGIAYANEFPECNPSFTSRSVDYNMTCGENVTLQPDGSFLAAKGGMLTLSFSGLKNCETYLFVKGIDITSEQPDTGEPREELFRFKIISDISQNKLVYKTPYDKYNDGQKDFLVNLGYQEEAKSFIQIKFPRNGSYRFEEIKVICQPMEQYPSQTDALRKSHMEQEEIGVNSVKGTINLPKDKILCLSIPYSKGWHAVVDGKEANLLKANIMYMALPLTKGAHTIELSYRTPGLYPGIAVSFVGFLLLGLLIQAHKKERYVSAHGTKDLPG